MGPRPELNRLRLRREAGEALRTLQAQKRETPPPRKASNGREERPGGSLEGNPMHPLHDARTEWTARPYARLVQSRVALALAAGDRVVSARGLESSTLTPREQRLFSLAGEGRCPRGASLLWLRLHDALQRKATDHEDADRDPRVRGVHA